MTSKDAKNTQAEEIREEKPGEEKEAEATAGAETTQADAAKETEKTAEHAEANETDAQTDDVQADEQKPEEEALQVQYMRLMADFQNFKRRTEKEKNDIYAFANEKIISELLNVIDNFERALLHGAAGDTFAEGMRMIFRQLQDVLKNAGVVEIEALGLDFDPNFHDAVMTEDSAEYESGKVSAVLQKGYMLNQKVIRPSMVKVAN